VVELARFDAGFAKAREHDDAVARDPRRPPETGSVREMRGVLPTARDETVRARVERVAPAADEPLEDPRELDAARERKGNLVTLAEDPVGRPERERRPDERRLVTARRSVL